MFDSVIRFVGIQSGVAWSEKIVSSVGGAIAILCTFYSSWFWTGHQGSMAILPSIGAATVLLFSVPHGQLSTPWALFGGNTLSAIVGVSCMLLVDSIYIAAALAVALSIFLMHFSRCLHPPGGATALAAVIGGDAIVNLGYWYVLTPTLINCSVLFLTAYIFNNLFMWRRYPLSNMRYQKVEYKPDTASIKTSHIHEAISRSNVLVDASDEQIKYIVDLADQIMRTEAVVNFDVTMGGFYSNGKPGLKWSVRQVLDWQQDVNPNKYRIVYKTVEGADKGVTGECSLQEFANWSHEMLMPKKKGINKNNII